VFAEEGTAGSMADARWRRRSSRWPRSAAPVRFATRARWHPAYP